MMLHGGTVHVTRYTQQAVLIRDIEGFWSAGEIHQNVGYCPNYEIGWL